MHFNTIKMQQLYNKKNVILRFLELLDYYLMLYQGL
jgi:hypothetical protein